MIAPEALNALVAASEEPYAVEWLDVARDAVKTVLWSLAAVIGCAILCAAGLIVWGIIR